MLRHFPSFRAAWTAAGIPLADAHWAPWTAAEERYLVATLGVRPTADIAATLDRGEPAVRSRARCLGLHVTDAHGWPIHRVARVAGLPEHVLRGYVDRGELCVFKGAKNVYIDVGDLVVIEELDWQHAPADLETAARHSLRWRLVQILAGRDWRTLRPHRSCPAQPDGIAARLQAARRFRGLSVPEVAATVGVARTTIRAWEAGTSPIPPAKQAVLAAALDIAPDLLCARAAPTSSTERPAPSTERSPAQHTGGTSRQLSTAPAPGDAPPAADETAPLRVPASPRTTRIVVELACLLCSRELGHARRPGLAHAGACPPQSTRLARGDHLRLAGPALCHVRRRRGDRRGHPARRADRSSVRLERRQTASRPSAEGGGRWPRLQQRRLMDPATRVVTFCEGACALCSAPLDSGRIVQPIDLHIIGPAGVVTIRCTLCEACQPTLAAVSDTSRRLAERLLGWFRATPSLWPAVVSRDE